MKVVVVVPTYNERENIQRLIPALARQFNGMQHDMHVLIVDDHSPDGTAQAARQLQSVHTNVHILEGPKRGLGVAYTRGMQHAIRALKADVVFEMDADFSHKPEDIPDLLAAIEDGADFVIGSRYVAGGSIPNEWGILRRLNSAVGNMVARYLAGIHTVRDCTAGFRAITAALLRRIDLSAMRVQGYAFQVALLHEATLQGATVKEVPVEFVDRNVGESKLGISDIVEFIVNAWWIRLRNSRTFLKFLAVGASGVAVNIASFTLLLMLGVNKFLASPIAIELSIVSNFLLNNYWTFRERETRDRVRVKGLKFNVVSVLALAVSYSTFVILSLWFPNVAPQIHQAIGIIPATIINYFLNTYWTFKHHPSEEYD